MKCLEVREQFTAYLDNEISSSERALIEQHLAECELCRRNLAALSETRSRLKSFLNVRAQQAAPEARDWGQLQEAAKTTAAKKAHSSARASFWPSRRAPAGTKASYPEGQGTYPMNKKIWTALAGLAALAVVIFIMARNVTTVSAQQILEKATAAQSAAEARQGIWHVVIEDYQNPGAVNGEETGVKTVIDDYSFVGVADPSAPAARGGYYRSVTRDEAGALVEVSAVDGKYDYSSYGPDGDSYKAGALTIFRTPLAQNQDQQIKNQTASTASSSTKEIFEQFRSNPRVKLEGKVTRTDGKEAYVLVDDSYRTENLPDGQVVKTQTGSMKMVFDALTYELLESTLTIRVGEKDIVLNSVQFTVNEILPADTAVAWDLSDLANVPVVDQPAEDRSGQDVTFETMTEEQLTGLIKTYMLDPLPEGYTREIVAVPGQTIDAEYRYEIHYTGPNGETFNMQAVGIMDPAFVQASFYDGSYKAASGLVLNYSTSSSEKSTNGMLITPEGQGFLVDSNLPRDRVEALVEMLKPTK
jgi:anti-sigma factor RsiW